MVHDKYGRQIEVGDEVILRGTVWFEEPGVDDVIELRTPSGGLHYVKPRSVEKVAADPGPFLTNDMPVAEYDSKRK